MELRFFGATGTTTGSCLRVTSLGRSVLLDCGMFQGRREESRRRNERFGFEAGAIDAVLQSHAHIDHSGKLPMLARHGFRGPVFVTPATRDLCEIMLHDSARILLQDAQHLNRERLRRRIADERARLGVRAEERRRRKGRAGRRRGRGADAADERSGESEPEFTPVPARGLPPAVLPAREVLPLFLEEDVELVLGQFHMRDYGDWFEPLPGMRARFHDAGHILGSAWIELEVVEHGVTKRLCFTGDYGRKHQPILRDPEPLERADILVSESTYGDRVHPPHEALEGQLAAAVQRLATRGRGRLLIPAFAVGRTQNILYSLARLYRTGAVQPVRVVVDSPLATSATQILVRHAHCFDDEARLEHRYWLEGSPLREWLSFTATIEDSKALNRDPRPTIVISASGMMENGRILHHLGWHLGSPDTELLIVGFQAEHTLGRRLLEGRPSVRIFGVEHVVRARITSLLGFSAHADRDELLAALEGHQPGTQAVFLVHGEDQQRRPLAESLAARGFRRVEQPADSSPYRF